MVRYPVTLTSDDNGTVLVTFPDFPEAHTFGDHNTEALARAVDALETIIDAYIRDRRDIPEPSAIAADSVRLPSLIATKVQLYKRMRHQHVTKSELARRLHVHMPQIDRLLDVKHGSRLEQLEAAAHALGGNLEVAFVVPDEFPIQAAAANVRRATGRYRTSGRPRRAAGMPVHARVLVARTKSTRLSSKKR
ncbi:MAG: HicB family protein [Acidobacteria bacterium]|nr:MAG: HicB family protein [Acidobacteriota bacterium]